MGLWATDWPLPPGDGSVPADSLVQTTCSIDSSELTPRGPNSWDLALNMICLHSNGNEYLVPIAVQNDGDKLEEQLLFLVGMEDLQVGFQFVSNYVLHQFWDNVTIRDREGELLFAAAVTSWESGVDGAEIDGPLGNGPPEEWFAPFEQFFIRDGLCPSTPAQPGPGLERRFAIEARAANTIVRGFDLTETMVEVEGRTFDFIVGQARAHVETTCTDCPYARADFLLIRRP